MEPENAISLCFEVTLLNIFDHKCDTVLQYRPPKEASMLEKSTNQKISSRKPVSTMSIIWPLVLFSLSLYMLSTIMSRYVDQDLAAYFIFNQQIGLNFDFHITTMPMCAVYVCSNRKGKCLSFHTSKWLQFIKVKVI